jgi:hypothetical protein
MITPLHISRWNAGCLTGKYAKCIGRLVDLMAYGQIIFLLSRFPLNRENYKCYNETHILDKELKMFTKVVDIFKANQKVIVADAVIVGCALVSLAIVGVVVHARDAAFAAKTAEALETVADLGAQAISEM